MFREDFDNAKKAMSAIVLPQFQKAMKATRVISFEDRENEDVPRLFDQYAGVDVVTLDKHGLRGVAMRIQDEQYARYETFTVREKRTSGVQTELSKRLNAIRRGYIYPYLTCQFYCSQTAIVCGAITRTLDLYQYIETHLDRLRKEQSRPAGEDGNIFIYVFFNELERNAIKLLRWRIQKATHVAREMPVPAKQTYLWMW